MTGKSERGSGKWEVGTEKISRRGSRGGRGSRGREDRGQRRSEVRGPKAEEDLLLTSAQVMQRQGRGHSEQSEATSRNLSSPAVKERCLDFARHDSPVHYLCRSQYAQMRTSALPTPPRPTQAGAGRPLRPGSAPLRAGLGSGALLSAYPDIRICAYAYITIRNAGPSTRPLPAWRQARALWRGSCGEPGSRSLPHEAPLPVSAAAHTIRVAWSGKHLGRVWRSAQR